MFLWSCDACGHRDLTEGKAKPNGWTDGPIVHLADDHLHNLELCPVCSKDTEAAVRRWEEKLGHAS